LFSRHGRKRALDGAFRCRRCACRPEAHSGRDSGVRASRVGRSQRSLCGSLSWRRCSVSRTAWRSNESMFGDSPAANVVPPGARIARRSLSPRLRGAEHRCRDAPRPTERTSPRRSSDNGSGRVGRSAPDLRVLTRSQSTTSTVAGDDVPLRLDDGDGTLLAPLGALGGEKPGRCALCRA